MKKPPKKKTRKLKKLSRDIIKAVGNGVIDFADVMTKMAPEYYQAGAFRVKYKRPMQKRSYDLEKTGYLMKDNRSFFHLTPKGKLEFLKIMHLEKILSGKWDGRWRVITFDIPEDLKEWREYLRRELKNLNFRQLQLSVYITPFPVTEEFKKLLERWEMEEYFHYMTVSEIDEEERLKEIFDLN